MEATKSTSEIDTSWQRFVPLAVLAVGSMVATYVYLNSLTITAEKWSNPQYSHGYLIPAFALALLWFRREPFWRDVSQVQIAGTAMFVVGAIVALVSYNTSLELWWLGAPLMVGGGVVLAAGGVLLKNYEASTSAVWTGVGMIAFGTLLRLGSAYYARPIPDMVSIVPCLLGVFLLAGSWKLLEWSWPAVVFLIFMFPLPDFVERGMLDPLQKVATQGSTFALQTLGVSAFSEGNRITISAEGGDVQMGVVDACSGLRMLTIFFALATAITLVTDRPIWERLVIIASAFPIALAVNMIRITVTGLLHMTMGSEIANKVFHDLAGWVMMPMALGFLYVELQILTHLFVEETSVVPMPMMRSAQGGPRLPQA